MRLAILAALLAAIPVAAETPSIVVILADDLGYGDVSAYNGSSKAPTPNIDSLARDGIRFTDAHSPAAVCVPTRYGLMTGRYPMRTELPWRTDALINEGRTTLASLLRDAGYATHMIGKWHLGFEGGHETQFTDLQGGPLDRGFDSFFGLASSLDQPPYYFIRGRDAVAAPTLDVEASASEGWSRIQGAFWREGRIAENYTHLNVLPTLIDETESRILRHRGKKEPLFLYLALTGPHTPWVPLEEFKGKGDAGLYGEFLTQVDHGVGRVLKALDDAGMRDDTLVIFTSDNGPVWYDSDDERFGHHAAGPLRGMKADSWEAGHRMPFLVRWPGEAPAGTTRDDTICFTDLLATFAALVGAELPDDAGEDSFNILPAFRGEPGEFPLRPSTVYKSGEVIRMGDWKLITHLGSGGFTEPRRVTPGEKDPPGQLYNLREDLGETKNLWKSRPDVVARLQRELARISENGRHR